MAKLKLKDVEKGMYLIPKKDSYNLTKGEVLTVLFKTKEQGEIILFCKTDAGYYVVEETNKEKFKVYKELSLDSANAGDKFKCLQWNTGNTFQKDCVYDVITVQTNGILGKTIQLQRNGKCESCFAHKGLWKKIKQEEVK